MLQTDVYPSLLLLEFVMDQHINLRSPGSVLNIKGWFLSILYQLEEIDVLILLKV